jgi:cyclopropane fatty-acyl-phospholipid synthase-like methyltransferase
MSRYYQSENYISHTNTSKGLVNRIYQWVRKRTLKQKASLILRATGLPHGNLLDMGSGVGAFVREMSDRGWKVTGLEPDPLARNAAMKFFHSELRDVNTFYQLEAANFDAITLWHVLEHVHELHAYMDQLKNLLSASGKIFIAVPNYTSADARKYKEYWAAYDVPRHLYHFSPLSMKLLVEKHGLVLKETLPMWFDSYYISLLSSKYKNGKTNWPGAMLAGWKSNRKAKEDATKCSSLIYIIEKSPAGKNFAESLS